MSNKLTQIIGPAPKNPKKIVCYFPLQREPPLLARFTSLHDQGRLVYMPVQGTTLLKSDDVFHPRVALRDGVRTPQNGYRGLDGTDENVMQHTYRGGIDFAILPGVFFNEHGVRLGHGGGRYDRLLANTVGDGNHSTHSTTFIGVAHFLQTILATDTLPIEDHDTRMNTIVFSKPKL